MTFGTVPAEVGDTVDQQIDFELRLKSHVRRGNQVLDKAEKTKTRGHTRRVTTTRVTAGRSTGVEVVYGEATDKAIAGKTYRCQREGETLRITDAQGKIPTPAEFEVVARHMELLGKPNPLAAFLEGKTIAVGQTVEVPAKVASRLFGSKVFGDTSSFRLRLIGVEPTEGGTLARFDAELQVVGSDGTQTRVEVAGPMTIEAATSRLASTKLLGPIAMHQGRHDPGGMVQVSATGRITVSLQTTATRTRVARRAGGWPWRR